MEVRSSLRRHGDLLIALVLTVLMSAELLQWEAGHSGADLPVALASVLLATSAQALRRRSPLVMFGGFMVGLAGLHHWVPSFDHSSMTLILLFFTALYSLGRHTTGIEAWLGGLLLAAEMLLFLSDDVGLTRADVGDVAFTIGFLGAPWAIGLTLRLKRERELALHAENERLRVEQAERAARAVAEERSRIARELHDVVSHAISVTVLQARGARRMFDTDPASVQRALDVIEQTNTAALGDMRRLLAVLRDTEPGLPEPDDRAPAPSLAHLGRLVDHVQESGVTVRVAVTGAPVPLPPGVDLSAYRIVQEALTNVLKHAPEATATVGLDYREDALRVTIRDDGTSLASSLEESSGHGLIGIRERVAVIGGQVEVGPAPEGGYAVSARLPYALEVS